MELSLPILAIAALALALALVASAHEPSEPGESVALRSHFARATFEFSTALTRRLAEEAEGHFAASPLSLWALLAAVCEGADGSTAQEVKRALGLNHHRYFVKKYYSIVGLLTTQRRQTTLERSGLMVVDENLGVRDDYKSALQKLGISDVLAMKITNFEDAAAEINDYVSRATRGTVQEITSADQLANKYLLLFDAIYFKSEWRTPFEAADTDVSAFYDERGKYAGDVNLMFTLSKFRAVDLDAAKAKVLELPYGEDQRHSMLVFLPHTGASLIDVASDLEYFTVAGILNTLAENEPTLVRVQLPRFKISSHLDNLRDLLIDMGIKSMFNETTASFPFITDYSIFVSDVVQKAEIEVTEKGTVAAAASAAEFESRSMPYIDDFNANRPFFFLIVDKIYRVVLFSGAYTKPSLY